MTKRRKRKLLEIIIASVITVTLMILSPESFILRLSLSLIAYLIVGHDVLANAAKNIINGQIFDEKFLMALATVGAFLINEFDEAVMVMVFFEVGELFEQIAVGKARKSISSLMDIRPDTANVIREGKELTVEPDEVQRDEIIVIKPGERIPLDGVVISGETTVDTSSLTGESLPRDIFEGDNVISGCVNLSGVVKVRVTGIFEESTASKILELVENSSLKKAKTENFITRFARYYTPAVVISSLLLAVIFSLVTRDIKEGVSRALMFLVVSCPCALVISVPLSFFGGIGGASRQGILIKGSNYLEALSKAETAVFDKTGTLTEGSFGITNIVAKGISEDEFIMYAAYAEASSPHPIAKSIVSHYGKDINKEQISNLCDISGYGITVNVDGMSVVIGNKKLMERENIAYDSVDTPATVVHMALNGEYIGYMLIADSIKPEAEEAINTLKRVGIEKTVMLSGDNKKTAEEVGGMLGLDEIYSELLPQDKVSVLEKLLKDKKKGRTLIYLGDGMNDAPVLSLADVGIAMGALGSDAAIEASDIVIMDDDPRKAAKAVKISKKTMSIVKQNIVFALGVKFAVLIMSALGLPFMNMWIAVFADVGVSVIAILNSMRALKTGK